MIKEVDYVGNYVKFATQDNNVVQSINNELENNIFKTEENCKIENYKTNLPKQLSLDDLSEKKHIHNYKYINNPKNNKEAMLMRCKCGKTIHQKDYKNYS